MAVVTYEEGLAKLGLNRVDPTVYADSYKEEERISTRTRGGRVYAESTWLPSYYRSSSRDRRGGNGGGMESELGYRWDER